MDDQNALIIGNGQPVSKKLFEQLSSSTHMLLCADGGANTVASYGCIPDYIVGDLDSVRCENRTTVAPNGIVRIDSDNTGTDLQKVLQYAVSLGITEAVLAGFTGFRTDHLLWNLSLLKTFATALRLRMVDDYCDIRLISKHIRFRATIGQKISLCPATGSVTDIETRGLKFPLFREELNPGVRDGISNEVTDNPVEVRVGAGDLLLVVQREDEESEIEILT